MKRQTVMVATVCKVNDNKDLIVKLDDGTQAYMPLEEFGRRQFDRNKNTSWLMGRILRVLVLHDHFKEGLPVCSGKAYEDYFFDCICDALSRKERNTYRAELNWTTPKLAFYRVAQGIDVSVHLSEFTFSRIANSFEEVRLPKYVTVCIKEIIGSNIHGTVKPAYGDFGYNISRLSLYEGREVEGLASAHLPNGFSTIVALSPNLSALCAGKINLGEKVRLRITDIDYDNHRFHTQLLDHTEEPFQFDLEEWLLPHDQLAAWVDLHAFEKCTRPARRSECNDFAAKFCEKMETKLESASVIPHEPMKKEGKSKLFFLSRFFKKAG